MNSTRVSFPFLRSIRQISSPISSELPDKRRLVWSGLDRVTLPQPSSDQRRRQFNSSPMALSSIGKDIESLDQKSMHAYSLENPARFWDHFGKKLDWFQVYKSVFQQDSAYGPFGYRWFSGGKMNTCYNALDRHVLAGNGDRTAIIYDSAITSTKKKMTYSELLQSVQVFSKVLVQQGVTKDDAVLIYMPMIPEAAVAMLSCARIGAMHSVVFGGFSAKELAKRIEDCKPKIILLASCGIEPSRVVPYKYLVDDAVDMCKSKPRVKIMLQRPQSPAPLTDGYLDWGACVQEAQKTSTHDYPSAVSLESHHPLYLLYTSGSTGTPKGILRDNGGHAVAAKFSVEQVFGLKPGDVIFSASDIGWVVGHTFIIYGPLLHGCTTVMFEGKPIGTPDAGTFWRMIEEYGVNTLFCAPTAIRAIQREDPKGAFVKKHDLSSLKNVFLAGEKTDPKTVAHYEELLGVPVRDHYWQTEVGWPITAPMVAPGGNGGTPFRLGSAGPPVPGYKVVVLASDASEMDDYIPELHHDQEDVNQALIPQGTELGPHETGNLALKLPLPPGCLTTLWKNPTGLRSSYLAKFPGYFDLTDAGFQDEDGYIHLLSRTDDVLNVAGHRLSSGGIEETVTLHERVAECAVVGMKDSVKGEIPIAFVVLNKHPLNAQEHTRSALQKEIFDLVRTHVGAIASLKQLYIVPRLPKTRSGKVARVLLRTMTHAANDPSTQTQLIIPPTLEDESVVTEIQDILVQQVRK